MIATRNSVAAHAHATRRRVLGTLGQRDDSEDANPVLADGDLDIHSLVAKPAATTHGWTQIDPVGPRRHTADLEGERGQLTGCDLVL